ncbi:hypothetical protein PO329_02025, partial [Escherichia coli]
ADRNRSHWSTSKTPSYTKSVSWQHHPTGRQVITVFLKILIGFPGLAWNTHYATGYFDCLV